MKKGIIKLAAGAAAILLMSTSAQAGYTMKKKVGDVDTKLTMFGFAQLEARGGDGTIAEDEASNVAFGAQRVRLGWKYVAGKVRGKVFLDFNQDAAPNYKTGDGAAMPKMVKDAFVSYVADPAFVAKLGLIKMPNGMGFTMPGWNLDIVERGFDKALALERNTGFMISGRGIGFSGNKVNGFEMGHERPWKGFGYDVMIANQASRSAAANSSKNGGNAYAVRGMFDYTEKLHLEASYAMSENAGGLDANVTVGNEDYSNFNFGVDSNLGPLSLKAEYFDATNIKGIKDYNEQVLTATAGYFVKDNIELTTKVISGKAQGNGADTSLTNTYLGVNLFLSQPKSDFSRKSKRGRNQHKVVANYILASGDTSGSTNEWNGLKGYKDNAFAIQYQFKF
ncbi:MAG: porin [Sulfurimonas sp.]